MAQHRQRWQLTAHAYLRADQLDLPALNGASKGVNDSELISTTNSSLARSTSPLPAKCCSLLSAAAPWSPGAAYRMSWKAGRWSCLWIRFMYSKFFCSTTCRACPKASMSTCAHQRPLVDCRSFRVAPGILFSEAMKGSDPTYGPVRVPGALFDMLSLSQPGTSRGSQWRTGKLHELHTASGAPIQDSKL